MMLNDLIEELVAIRDEHGDTPVYIWDCYNDCETTEFEAEFSIRQDQNYVSVAPPIGPRVDLR
jgi:hypothetical protein